MSSEITVTAVFIDPSDRSQTALRPQALLAGRFAWSGSAPFHPLFTERSLFEVVDGLRRYGFLVFQKVSIDITPPEILICPRTTAAAEQE